MKPTKRLSWRWLFFWLTPAVFPAILYATYFLIKKPKKCPGCGFENVPPGKNKPRFLPGSQICILQGDYQGQMGWIDAVVKRHQGVWLYTARLRNKARVNESIIAHNLEEKWLDFA
jgi:hypothetical protein